MGCKGSSCLNSDHPYRSNGGSRYCVDYRPECDVVGVEAAEEGIGYRELRSAGKMRKLLNRKTVEQDRKCAICHEEFTDYNDVVPG